MRCVADGRKAALVFTACSVLAACRQPAASEAGASKEESAKSLSGLVLGEERAIGAGVFMTMHQMGVTAPLGDGWNLARSTEGAFSVEVPLPFNDFRIRSETTDHVELRSYSIGGKTPGLLAWSATCMARRDGQLGTDHHAPAPETTEVQGDPPRAQSRRVEFPDLLCVLIVDAQGTDPLPPEADRLRFLGSLKRTGKPRW
jgi:hypothetical protein